MIDRLQVPAKCEEPVFLVGGSCVLADLLEPANPAHRLAVTTGAIAYLVTEIP